MRKYYWFLWLVWMLIACTPQPSPVKGRLDLPASTLTLPSSPPATSPAPTPTTTPLPTEATPEYTQSACQLQPITVPTRPAVIPPTNQLDVTSGLHMTGSVQEIDLASYVLKINGLVDHPLNLTYDELRCMPKITATTTIRCGFFADTATWSGVPLTYILDNAGIKPDATNIELYGADGYSAQVSMDEVMQANNFLAYEWQGEPLPILHGFPLRAIFPLIRGSAAVKWLMEIKVK